ncbi:UDP-4-amino-4,6-dideoxy-N-acetyl-beta-L-altrosamine transaminase [Alkalibacillus haloalkaliphilus]|uniref:UDP-4-amino-4, 6-dideoxy-N-acetyl-beta-L-altrosamine transaminase n=1 Tax=Alkalibacillus haloalkaliphilus TaxID=94136 RepID=UPI002935BC8B|nr:UDP-4-amino-4,6-dideoxy-N-acetyl-beta-L-altrosamine transaminase [Alkalibacillus haloalkaliphilus]MDV2583346.1 UDP-4-amino-4,6-dideoxy-N-acetyl-beta-L-altrosamine transaminase [Alkalibacillus haloalkaliphilus]
MSDSIKLAIHGGDPVRKTYLPYGKQWIDDEDIHSVIQTLQSDYLTTGPTIDQFEKRLADYVGAKYAVSFANGTAALHAASFVAGIEKGYEVITTPMTFAASANSILYNGGKPVFADIDPKTYNISPESVQSLINEKTKAIIPVDFTGQPCDYDQIIRCAEEYGLTIIEDAAHAFGAKYQEKRVGSISDMTIFSFHPVKHMTTGEGGVVTTNEQEFYKQLIQFRTHGITRESSKLLENHGPWYYEMQFLGYNYRMTDIQAALGLSQINKIDYFIERRKKYVNMYNEAFQLLREVETPSQLPGYDSSWHLYVIRLNLNQLTVDRKVIFEALQKENIGVNVHYIPVHYQPFYRGLGYEKGICPNAEQLYEKIITLPLFPAMSEQDVLDVIKAVQKVIKYYAK